MMNSQRVDFMIINIRAGDRRHPETLPYRCCLSTLAGFGRLCRAGPARTGVRIPGMKGCVNAVFARYFCFTRFIFLNSSVNPKY